MKFEFIISIVNLSITCLLNMNTRVFAQNPNNDLIINDVQKLLSNTLVAIQKYLGNVVTNKVIIDINSFLTTASLDLTLLITNNYNCAKITSTTTTTTKSTTTITTSKTTTTTSTITSTTSATTTTATKTTTATRCDFTNKENNTFVFTGF
jgi:hypothetical protein